MTTTKSFAPDGMPSLPSIGKGPFRDHEVTVWREILLAADKIKDQCIDGFEPKPRAGVRRGAVTGRFVQMLWLFVSCLKTKEVYSISNFI